MFIGRLIRVPEDVRTLRDLLTGALDLAGLGASPDAIEGLADEVWNAPQNAGLHAVAREHRGGAGTGGLELAPDEWVYVPFPPPGGYEMRRLDLTGAETSEDEICDAVRTHYAEDGFSFPGAHLTPGDLEAVLLNSRLRTGAQPTEVYFYVVPEALVATEVAPNTAASGMTSTAVAAASPDWLIALWHWIDRLHNAAEEHAGALQDLFDLCAEGKMIATALTTIDGFLRVIERECSTPEPTSTAQRIALRMNRAAGFFNIQDFHAKVRSLRDAAQSAYVDDCRFSVLAPFREHCDALKALDAHPAFLAAYQQFDKVRAQYPATEHALQTVLAFYTLCRGHSPDGDDFVAKIDKAVHGAPDNTPLLLEIAAILKVAADNVVSPASAMIGNAPGSLTMLVAFGKLHMLWKLKTPKTAVVTVEKYVSWAAKLANVDHAKLAQEVAQSGAATSDRAKLFITRMKATELAANEMHASARWLGLVSIMDAIVLVSVLSSTYDDVRQKKWLDGSADALSAATTGTALIGAVIQLRVAEKTKAVMLMLKSFSKLEAEDVASAATSDLSRWAAIFGKMVGILGIASGLLQCVQSMRTAETDERRAKMAAGIGTVLVSLQQFVDMFFARFGAALCDRIVASIVAEELAPVVGGTLAVAMAGAGALLAGVGVLLVLGALVYTNREAIRALLEEASVPGPAKACRAYLKAIESTRALKMGPSGVRDALAQATSALAAARFVNYVPPDGVAAELKGLGMSDEDLVVIRSIAPLSPDFAASAWSGI